MEPSTGRPPRLSIITCTKDSARYLPESLASLHSQSYQNIEHIVIDGGSADGTLDIIARLAPEARVYRQSGQGLYNALNEGLARASGDAIGFLHSDDLFADERCLERVAAAFKQEPALGFFCSRMEVFDTVSGQAFARLGAAPHSPAWQEWLYSSNYYAHPTYYCSRQAVRRVGAYDERFRIAADVDWLIRLERLGLPFRFDPRPLIRFRAAHGLSARHHILALREEWLVRIKNSQASPALALVYGWHLLRRSIRIILEKASLYTLIRSGRRLIGHFHKRSF